jgi:hypothetical protein
MGRLEVLFLGLTCCLAAACAAKVSRNPTRDYSPLSFTKIWELGQSLEGGRQSTERQEKASEPTSTPSSGPA